ncbi:delta chain of chloroplast ATP synthase [Chloropicon primus]|uniref:Delta chain of chloroplast ATP synthase n=1 Tax=Chloropicon primus TaxID=1764295 RepID=A0A5B8MFN3_9CHLO|nr:delta chain of chloroplast ATP synthase [Chloropicon primus]UPQ98418.1 delta chain of chloroplast ATP synthase [Chloropicon primus]|eukprot:QDZ19209.1 delta chain of chloroplast ATP synthase [Chloropicon primus]
MRVVGRTQTCMRGKGLSLTASTRRVSGASGSRRRTVMKADAVATQYATAFVNLAKDKNVLDDVRSDMDSVANLMKTDAKLSSFLTNPVADGDKKKSLINSIAKEASFNALSENFLCLLVDKQRIGGITDICESFESIYCEVTDTEVATVTSAAALDNDQQFEIAKKLQKLTGAKNIKLKPKVDSSLISGLVIQYGKGGSKLLDMSARGQLARIEAQLLSQAPSA